MKPTINILIGNERPIEVYYNIADIKILPLEIHTPWVYELKRDTWETFVKIYITRNDKKKDFLDLTITDDEWDAITEKDVCTLYELTWTDVRYSLRRTLIAYVGEIESTNPYVYQDENVRMQVDGSLWQLISQTIYDDYISDMLDALAHKKWQYV